MTKPATAQKPATNGLPNKLLQTLPSAEVTLTNCVVMNDCAKLLVMEMGDAKKKGAIQLARAFVVLHHVKEKLDEATKLFAQTVEDYKKLKIPEAFEQEGVTSVPLEEGFRVQVSARTFVSIKPDQKDAAYEWLTANGFESLIVTTVNSSTLSAAAKSMMEEHNKELPDTLFNVALVPNTSVNPTK